MVANRKANEIYITRTYDAPVAVVWDAWTDPQQVSQWWGPRGFTLTHHSKELRPGGIWHYTMHGPDGVDYPNKTLYHEVEEHRKLVYDHGGNDEQAPLFRVTVLFSEVDGQTLMEMTMALPTAEEAEATRKFIKQAGGNATWDRLAEYLRATQAGETCFVINRTFEVPRDVMFRMWTDPTSLTAWQPPTGFTMEIVSGGIRPGEDLFFRMSNQDGMSFHGRFRYQEIESPCRLVYLQEFCDAAGNLSRHPGLPEFPATLKTTVLLADEAENWTRVTVVSELVGPTEAAEIDAFVNERSGMTQGWTGSFDKLEIGLSRRL